MLRAHCCHVQEAAQVVWEHLFHGHVPMPRLWFEAPTDGRDGFLARTNGGTVYIDSNCTDADTLAGLFARLHLIASGGGDDAWEGYRYRCCE